MKGQTRNENRVMKLEPIQERLQELFDYNEIKGCLIRKIKPHPKYNFEIGKEYYGVLGGDGYFKIPVDGRTCRVHRILWILKNGSIPYGMQIDHINGVRTDNNINNLRLVSASENQHNRKLSKNNTSGYQGVGLYNLRGKNVWRSAIKVNGKRKYLGFFDSPEEAYAAYCAAKKELHPTQQNPRGDK